MLVCITVLYEYMDSLGNYVCNLFVNMHVRIKIYCEFYHCIIYITNEGRVKLVIRVAYPNSFIEVCPVVSEIQLLQKL